MPVNRPVSRAKQAAQHSFQSGKINRKKLETFRTYQTIEEKAGFAHEYLSKTSSDLASRWAATYELLAVVRDQEVWKTIPEVHDTEYYGGTFESFQDYFEKVVGEPFRVFLEMESTYHVLRDVDTDQLNVTYEQAKAIAKDMKLAVQQAKERPLAEHGGDQKSETVQNQDSNTTLMRDRSSDYTLRRLARDGHDSLLDQIETGQLSVNQAAIQVGYRKKTFTVVAGNADSAAKTLLKHYDKTTLIDALNSV